MPYTWCGAFNNNFPGFSVLGFHRKLARTKTQQVTDKTSKRGIFAVFGISRASTELASTFCIPDPLLILLPCYLRQLTFSPLPEYAAAILNHVSVPLSVTPPSPPQLLITHPHPIHFLYRPFLFA